MHATVIIFCGLFALAAPAIYTGAEARLRGAQARANRQPIDDAILLVTEAVRNLEDPLLNCTTVEMGRAVEEYPGWKTALTRELAAQGYRAEIKSEGFCFFCSDCPHPGKKSCIGDISIQVCWEPLVFTV
jgi:hypothetical protein